MSKAIKSVTKAAGGILGGGIGGLIPGVGKIIGGVGEVAGGQPQFKGSVRKIDEKAFNIADAKDAAQRARVQEVRSRDRSEQAQQDNRQLIEQLQAQAAGTAPSLAEAQLRSASERNLAQQLAAAQSQQGGSAAARERQLMQNQAASGRELAQDATVARLQEQQQAQQLLAGQLQVEQQQADALLNQYLQAGFTIEQARQQAAADLEKLKTNQFLSAQGLTAASQEAASGRQAGFLGGLLNAGGGIGAAMISDKNEKKKIKKASKKDMANMLKAQSSAGSKKSIKKDTFADKLSKSGNKEIIKSYNKEQAEKGKKLADKRRAEKEKSEKDKKSKIVSAGMQGFSQGMATGSEASDAAVSKALNISERARSEISDKKEKKNMATDVKKDFLDKLQAYTYEYKNPEKPGAGEGRFMSVMAQDLEKAGPIGKSMVQDMEDGTKMVDYGKGFGAILAAQAHLNKRLEELEKKKRK